MKMNKILTLAVLLGMFCAAIGLASGSVCEAGGVGVGARLSETVIEVEDNHEGGD